MDRLVIPNLADVLAAVPRAVRPVTLAPVPATATSVAGVDIPEANTEGRFLIGQATVWDRQALQGGPIIDRAAFDKYLRDGFHRPAFLFEHGAGFLGNPVPPLGVIHRIEPNRVGLGFLAELAQTPIGYHYAELIRIGAVDDVSIGFASREVVPIMVDGEPVPVVREAWLIDISLAVMGRMPGARILQQLSLRETEDYVHIEQFTPGLCRAGTTGLMILDQRGGVDAVTCKQAADTESQVQAFRFHRAKGWTPQTAEAWVAAHAPALPVPLPTLIEGLSFPLCVKGRGCLTCEEIGDGKAHPVIDRDSHSAIGGNGGPSPNDQRLPLDELLRLRRREQTIEAELGD